MTAVERDLLYNRMMAMDNFETELILHEPADTSVGGSNNPGLSQPSRSRERGDRDDYPCR